MQDLHQTADKELQEAAQRLLCLRQSPLNLPLNVYSSVNQRPFFTALILIMEELYPEIVCRPLMLQNVSRSNYGWHLIFKSWCPIHKKQHAQQHWNIFQYHHIKGETCQWMVCLQEPHLKVKLQGIPFYDELENKKDY